MSPWLVYMMMEADSLIKFFGTIGTLAAVLSIGIYGLTTAELVIDGNSMDEDDKGRIIRARNIAKPVAIVACIFLPLAVLMPGSKTIATIIGVQAITQIEDVSKLPNNTVKALNKVLEQYIEEDDE